MDIQAALKNILAHQNLSFDDMQAVMQCMMTGKATSAQIAGLLVALRMKGESIDELTAAALVMRALATPVKIEGKPLLDTCGTGGDGASTFNVSTVSAFVAAAAGAFVAKHGNRSNTSASGSADLLEAAGANIHLSPTATKRAIEEMGIGFLFAPNYHEAMKYAIAPRKELGVRTLFNLLGPLTNPALAPHQLLGVFDSRWLEPMALVLRRLGSHHALIVHAKDGLDEVSLNAETEIVELKNGRIFGYEITGEQFGFSRAPLDHLRVGSPMESLQKSLKALTAAPSPERDIVALNAGAAIYAADLVLSLQEGVALAMKLLETGAAKAKWDAFIAFGRETR